MNDILDPEYYKRFPEIFDGDHFLPPQDVMHQLSRDDWFLLYKLENGERLTPSDAETLQQLINKITAYYVTKNLSDEELLMHIKFLKKKLEWSNRDDMGPWGETSFYNMRRIVRAYMHMHGLSLGALLEEAIKRRIVTTREFAELVFNLMYQSGDKKYITLAQRTIRLVDGSFVKSELFESALYRAYRGLDFLPKEGESDDLIKKSGLSESLVFEIPQMRG